MDADAFAGQILRQVLRERRRITLREERAVTRVAGQNRGLVIRQAGDGPIHGISADVTQVDGIVHVDGARPGGRDDADRRIIGSSGWGYRHCAHREGYEGGDADACNGAAHGSSSFTCHYHAHIFVRAKTIISMFVTGHIHLKNPAEIQGQRRSRHPAKSPSHTRHTRPRTYRAGHPLLERAIPTRNARGAAHEESCAAPGRSTGEGTPAS